MAKPRARELLGFPGETGIFNAITDIPGVNPKVNQIGPQTTEQRPISPHDETTS